jgi:hypothetical protein
MRLQRKISLHLGQAREGDPNSGMDILLSWFLSDFLPNAPAHGRRVSYAPWSR